MTSAAIHGGLVNSPTEWQLVVALLVTTVLLLAASLGLAWLARRLFFPASPRAKRYFWIIAASAMTAGVTAFAVPFYLFIA